MPDFQLFLHSPCRRPAVRACPRTQPMKNSGKSELTLTVIYPIIPQSMSMNSDVEDQPPISCAVAGLRVPAAMAVNGRLPENTSGASDEGGTFALSMILMASCVGHWRGTTLIVFSASRQSGRGIRAGLIFCSFCIKTKGKEKDYS